MQQNLLTIEFIGLHIHFSKDQNKNLPPKHRIVIPHSDTAVCWQGSTIAVHEPFLQLGKGVMMPLRGVTLRVLGGNPIDGLVKKFQCLPRLRTIWPDMVLDDHAVTGKGGHAAAYFDTDIGFFEAVPFGGSAGMVLTIGCEDSVAQLELDFWKGKEKATIELTLPATISIQNTGKAAKSDGFFDFVLNYLIASNFPPGPLPDLQRYLNQVDPCLGVHSNRSSSDPGDLGPGCSNSQYP